MKSLVIAEKPSVARDIARVLKCGKAENGAIEGGQYIVTWGLGHLVELADPEAYDPKYKEWRMEDLPMMPEPFKLEVIRQTNKQYQAVRAQLGRHGRGARGRIGGASDLKEGGLPKAGETAVDFLGDGQGNPGGLRQLKGREGV